MRIRTHHKCKIIICLFLAAVLCIGIHPMQAYTQTANVTFDSEMYTVAFDPDDGKTTYSNFYKTSVPKGGKITTKPEDPHRDGYIFKGWYNALDQNNNPILWKFQFDTVEEGNLTLWAAWETGCIVAFDPDNGKATYNDFFKTTVPIGGKVTSKPEDPKRDGYFFNGWYSHLDANGNPVPWNFQTDTVEENTTLWAAWEEGCIVAFDPDNGAATYNDFYKVLVPVGGKVTDRPENPLRDGYLFKGWYSHLDANSAPILWDFDADTVHENITLWAAWEKDLDTGGNGGNDNDSGTGGRLSGRERNTPVQDHSDKAILSENKVPLTPEPGKDTIPKTGADSTELILYGALALIVLVLSGLSLSGRRKSK